MLCVLTNCVGELPATLTLFAVCLCDCYGKTCNITLYSTIAVCNFNSRSDEDFRQCFDFCIEEVCKVAVCVKNNLCFKWLTDYLFVTSKFKSLLNIGSDFVNLIPLCNKFFISVNIVALWNIIEER